LKHRWQYRSPSQPLQRSVASSLQIQHQGNSSTAVSVALTAGAFTALMDESFCQSVVYIITQSDTTLYQTNYSNA